MSELKGWRDYIGKSIEWAEVAERELGAGDSWRAAAYYLELAKFARSVEFMDDGAYTGEFGVLEQGRFDDDAAGYADGGDNDDSVDEEWLAHIIEEHERLEADSGESQV